MPRGLSYAIVVPALEEKEVSMISYRVIVAGGTIDAAKYNFADGRVLSFGEPAVVPIFQIGGVEGPLTSTRAPLDEAADILILEQKDSLDMTDDDRVRILILCLLETRKHIIITHGTDTMIQTGLFLAPHLYGKTVILVGAMRPYRSSDSDASFNIGGAVIACKTLPPGVWLSMNGKVFPVENAMKVKEAGRAYFTEKYPSYHRRSRPDTGKAIARLFRKSRGGTQDLLISVKIPCEARRSRDELREVLELVKVQPREVYWTAGYHPHTLKRYLAPVNHHFWVVIGGNSLGLKDELLVGTGNTLIGLPPVILRVTHRVSNNERIVFLGNLVGIFKRWQILFSTGIQQQYWFDKLRLGGLEDLHATRTRNLLKKFWR